jgi:prepilin-type processing-associated H-X9-DG protein
LREAEHVDDFLDQIEAALHARLYYVSLHASLAVPDICGAAGSADGMASKSKYIAWFDGHVAPSYSFAGRAPMLNGEDCYYFRNSMLHQGSSEHPKSRYVKVLFVEPGAAPGILLHCNVMNDALNIDVNVFCLDTVNAARRWLEPVKRTPLFLANAAKFMTRHPAGLAPYIVGLPVIA